MQFELSLRHAFENFSLSVELRMTSGVTVLFGPSGSGKTTTIRMVAGLLRPDFARITLGEEVLCDTDRRIFLPAHQRRLGYVFQDGRLFPHLTVLENLRFAPSAQAKSRDEADLVDLLGLKQLLNRAPLGLSGGERQRVALARALLSGPRMLLLDEPLAALDGPRKDEILPYLNRLKSHANIPILYVTHSVDEMARLGDHVAVLKDGQVVQHGPVFEVMAAPSAMPLIGVREAGAVLQARVEGATEDGLTQLMTSAGRLEVPRMTASQGEHLRVRILAQDIILAREKPQGLSARNIFAVEIETVEIGRGPGVAIGLKLGQDRLLARITARSHAELGFATGQRVFAIIKATSVSRGLIGSTSGRTS